MNKISLSIAIILTHITMWAQAPPIPISGPIGSQGNFPIINSPALVFASDADHTMAYPEMSGSSGALIVTSSVSLTSGRNVIVPVTGNFVWPAVRNNTTGGQVITFKTSSGTGVTIPNGDVATVMCDTVNCYGPNGGGGSGIVGTFTIPPGISISGDTCATAFNVTMSSTIPSGATVAVSPGQGYSGGSFAGIRYFVDTVSGSSVKVYFCNDWTGAPGLPAGVFNLAVVGGGSGGSGGTVTKVIAGNIPSAGNFATTAVASPTGTPTLSWTLANAAPYSVWGNFTNAVGTPGYGLLTVPMLPITPSGNTTVYGTANGSFIANDGVTTDANHNFVDTGLPAVTAGFNAISCVSSIAIIPSGTNSIVLSCAVSTITIPNGPISGSPCTTIQVSQNGTGGFSFSGWSGNTRGTMTVSPVANSFNSQTMCWNPIAALWISGEAITNE